MLAAATVKHAKGENSFHILTRVQHLEKKKKKKHKQKTQDEAQLAAHVCFYVDANQLAWAHSGVNTGAKGVNTNTHLGLLTPSPDCYLDS